MPYVVEVESAFRARRGLPSPVRRRAGLPTLDDGDGRPFVLRVGLTFANETVENSSGRAVDSDVAFLSVDRATRSISTRPWTVLFDFRRSLERVARHLFDNLTKSLVELSYVEIQDITAGVTVRYQP